MLSIMDTIVILEACNSIDVYTCTVTSLYEQRNTNDEMHNKD